MDLRYQGAPICPPCTLSLVTHGGESVAERWPARAGVHGGPSGSWLIRLRRRLPVTCRNAGHRRSWVITGVCRNAVSSEWGYHGPPVGLPPGPDLRSATRST